MRLRRSQHSLALPQPRNLLFKSWRPRCIGEQVCRWKLLPCYNITNSLTTALRLKQLRKTRMMHPTPVPSLMRPALTWLF